MINFNANYSFANKGLLKPLPVALGRVFTDTNFVAGSKYALSGAGITFSGGQINMTGGTASFNDYITLIDPTFPFNYTCLENFKIVVKAITPSTIDLNSYGIGVGWRSAESTNVLMNALFRWGWDTGDVNQWHMYPNNSLTAQISTGATINPTASQTVYIDIVRVKNVYTCTAYQSDHTTVIGVAATFTMSLTTGATNQAHNTSRFVIENFGGTNLKILEWTITSTSLKFPDWAVIGDSNTYGMFATSNANRYAEHAMTLKGRSFSLAAGIDDHTQDVLNRLPEILTGIRPTSGVVLNIGSNDVADGVASGTWQANITSIINQIKATGVKVILISPFARSVDLTALNTYISGKTGVTYLDFFTATKGAGTALNATFDSGDGIHGNLACNNAVYPLLQAVL